MKKLFLALLGIAGATLTAQAQSDVISFHPPLDNSPILVAGAAPVNTQPAYNQQVIYSPPVQYDAPVQYVAPVQYNGPVQYYAPTVGYTPVYYWPAACADDSCSTVQVIVFGEGQACQQGYSFGLGR